jgi:hypothetical protein
MRVIALILLAACSGSVDGSDDDGTPDGGNNPDATTHEFCVTESNKYRAGGGVPAVTRSTQLETYADMGAQVDYNGSPHQHFSSTSGGGIAFAENECPHWDLSFGGGDEKALIAACIKAFFDEGPGSDFGTHGHYINLMNAQYRTLGCGIFKNGSDYTILQDFGQ